MNRRWGVAATLILLPLSARHAAALGASNPPEIENPRPRIIELVESSQPEGENGWPLMLEALDIVVSVGEELTGSEDKIDQPAFRYQDLLKGPLPDDESNSLALRAVRMLEERGAFEKMREASMCARAVRPFVSEEGRLFDEPLRELYKMRGYANARMAAARLAAAEGDWADVVSAVDECLYMANAISRQFAMIQRLVGIAIATLVLHELDYLLQEHQFEPATYRQLLGVLNTRLPLPSIEIQVEGERRFAIDSINHLCTDERGGRWYPSTAELEQFGGGKVFNDPPVSVELLYDRGRSIEEINRHFDRMLLESRRGPHERRPGEIDLTVELEDQFPGALLVAILVGAIDRGLDHDQMLNVIIDVAKIEVAIDGHRAETGRYPERLEDLVPAWFDHFPIDRMNQRGFVYRPPASAKLSYALYCIGADGEDNGGVPPMEAGKPAPAKALSVRESNARGTDYVVRLPRPIAESAD